MVWRRIWDFAAEPSPGSRLKGSGFISLKMTGLVDRSMVSSGQAAYRVSFVEEIRYIHGYSMRDIREEGVVSSVY